MYLNKNIKLALAQYYMERNRSNEWFVKKYKNHLKSAVDALLNTHSSSYFFELPNENPFPFDKDAATDRVFKEAQKANITPERVAGSFIFHKKGCASIVVDEYNYLDGGRKL